MTLKETDTDPAGAERSETRNTSPSPVTISSSEVWISNVSCMIVPSADGAWSVIVMGTNALSCAHMGSGFQSSDIPQDR